MKIVSASIIIQINYVINESRKAFNFTYAYIYLCTNFGNNRTSESCSKLASVIHIKHTKIAT